MRLAHLMTLPAALCAAALVSTGCGKDAEPAPPDAGVDTETYFGMKVGRCYEYTAADTKQTAPDLGIVVEKIDEKQFTLPTPDGPKAVPTYQIGYRNPGRVMEDFVSIDGNEIKLHKRSYQGGRTFIYSPPLTLMRSPVKPGEELLSKGKGQIREPITGELVSSEDHSLAVVVFNPEQVNLPIGSTVTGYKVLYQETPATRTEVRTLVPGTGVEGAVEGWVKLEYNFHPTEPTRAPIIYKLQAVRDLAAERIQDCGARP